ncbi:MAG: hypothetical protein IE926_19040 [Micrococcales bacterium]|nr:hypothetical protein [Micrococcales bacterium]
MTLLDLTARPTSDARLATLPVVIIGAGPVGLAAAVARPLGYTGEPVVLGFALALAAVSAVVLALAVRGRASGFSGFLVIALGVLTVFSFLVSHSTARGGVGDRVWSPTSTSLPATYHLGAGDATLDLDGLATWTPAGGEPATVDVSVGVGELTVRVPAGLDVRVDNQIGVGEVRHERVSSGGVTETLDDRSGTDVRRDVTVGDGTSPDLVVTAEIGIGDVIIIEES